MLRPADLSGAFANNDAGSHGFAGGYARHDRPVRSTKSFDFLDFENPINH